MKKRVSAEESTVVTAILPTPRIAQSILETKPRSSLRVRAMKSEATKE